MNDIDILKKILDSENSNNLNVATSEDIQKVINSEIGLSNDKAITPQTLSEYNNSIKDTYALKTEIETHTNKDVLDLLTMYNGELLFNGKSVHKIELPDGQINYTATFMNVTANTEYGITIEKGSKLCDQIVQVWEFEEGGTDITTVAKTFNNHTSENFFYDSENIEFTDDVCKVKDEYILDNFLNSDGFYETKLNKNDFIELISLTSEVIE